MKPAGLQRWAGLPKGDGGREDHEQVVREVGLPVQGPEVGMCLASLRDSRWWLALRVRGRQQEITVRALAFSLSKSRFEQGVSDLPYV